MAPPRPTDEPGLRIALIGAGMIAGEVTTALRSRAGVQVVGAWDRARIDASGGWDHVLAELNHRADLVIEAATQDAVRDYGPSIIGSGLDLIVLSIGALSDPDLRAMLSAGPGRVLLSTGAIAGIDHLRAMRIVGKFRSVSIESRKMPAALRQPWMSKAQLGELDTTDEPITLLRGSAAEVAAAFPSSANVAAAVAIATDSWDRMVATVIADPAATLTKHTVTAHNGSGRCELVVQNEPSRIRPRSSMITVYSIVRAVCDLAYQSGRAEAPPTMTFV